MKIKTVDGSIKIEPQKTEELSLANRNEICVFKEQNEEGIEKVYYLDINYEDNKTSLNYYVTTEEERKKEFHDPDIFSKELPLLPVRPNFVNKSALIDRMNNWILMS